ncbi:MAG: RHS repeat-associated core domain-containing protein [Nitrospirae bacterium]|nr:RHS repeat-associated core domain-containing protein [Nitrospirota bacterium]
MRGDPYLARERKRRPRQHHGGPPQGGLALTYPGNKTVTYTYDALNRLETVSIGWLSGQQVATYIYDDAGRMEEFTNFNGISTAYGYDDANRLLSIDSPVASYGFVLDGNGNRTDETSDEPLPQTYSADVTPYGYNARGNRLVSAGNTGFGYDNEGQLANGYGGGYTFDALHRLIAMPGATFAYDGANNRLQAVRNGVTTRYLYDAAGNLLAETDGSNNITRYYVYGAGLLAMVTPAGEVYCYHFNATGGTVAVTDEAQSIVNKYSYDPFGNVGTQVEAIAQPFKYVGQFGVMAEPNGFYYMRARYYDPKVGRFISEDPLGFGGGDVNLMGYVGNNPVNFVDPTGLCTEKDGVYYDKDGNIIGEKGLETPLVDPVDVLLIGGTVTVKVAKGAFTEVLSSPKVQGKIFRIDVDGLWKTSGEWVSGKHFHFDPTGTGRLMKHHLPDQLNSWWGHLKSVVKELWRRK